MLRHYEIVNNKLEETADEKSPVLCPSTPTRRRNGS